MYYSKEKVPGALELPPVPPVGIFDVRFDNNKIVTESSNIGAQIQINSAAYPITVSAHNFADKILKVSDALGGKVLNQTVQNEQEITISAKLNKIKIVATELPKEFKVSQNYPNPFNPNTTIQFSLPIPSKVEITVYDILGNEVLVLVNKEFDAGNHEIDFNASSFASGVYIYRFQASSFNKVQKMIILK